MAQEAGHELFARADDVHSRILDVDMSGSSTADMDMICGGSLGILVEVLAPSPETVAVFAAASAAVRAGRHCLVAVRLPVGGAAPVHCVLDVDGDSSNTPATTCDGPAPDAATLSTILDVSGHGPWTRTPPGPDGTRWLVETLQPPDTLYLFGAGHVAQSTAAVAAQADFRVTVLDDRSEFACLERYPDADRVVILDSFEDVFASPSLAGDRIGAASYLVIVTRGHSHDGLVLRQALGTAAGYVGMIGSRSKRNGVYNRLRADGFTDAALARVHCPIGLEIGAQTPGEIAVSIVAELVRHRRRTDRDLTR
jgi:xanthine dehydrogenase accessory factor